MGSNPVALFKHICEFDKFIETLFSKNELYSSLSDTGISNKEYQNHLKVLKKFEMKTRKNYHNFYLKCDALLLGCVSENFKNST